MKTGDKKLFFECLVFNDGANMLREKSERALRLSYTIFCVALFFIIPFGNGYSWDVKLIDFETHMNSTDLVKGSYLDKGAWTVGVWPPCSNGGQRYLTVAKDPQRHGIAFWLVQVPQTGFYKLEVSYFGTENRTKDADYSVYVNATTSAAENKTASAIKTVTVSQFSDKAAGEIPWIDLGTHCLKANDIPMIVLDGRDDSGSDSADAARFTFVGESGGSGSCTGTGTMSPVGGGSGEGTDDSQATRL